MTNLNHREFLDVVREMDHVPEDLQAEWNLIARHCEFFSCVKPDFFERISNMSTVKVMLVRRWPAGEGRFEGLYLDAEGWPWSTTEYAFPGGRRVTAYPTVRHNIDPKVVRETLAHLQSVFPPKGDA